MPTKLKFKGEKTKKKRKHEEDGGAGTKRKRHDAEAEDDSAWVRPDRVEELRGPIFIVHPSDPTPVCIGFDATRGKVTVSSLGKTSKVEDEDGEDGSRDQSNLPVMERTPTDVSQVWVATRVAGADTLTLRSGVASSTGSGETKFLSCDRHGLVSADREARGPEESWTPILLPDGMIAFQSVYENYLGLDEVAGGSKASRGDATEIGFNERFWVKIQAKYKREADQEQRKKEGGKKGRVDEAGTNHTYQAWGAGRSVVSSEDKRELHKAQKEGNLSEALLDRRSKLKSDRFC